MNRQQIKTAIDKTMVKYSTNGNHLHGSVPPSNCRHNRQNHLYAKSFIFPLLICWIGLLPPANLQAQENKELLMNENAGIRINQVGFFQKGPKQAIIEGVERRAVPFYVVRLNQFADTVFKGQGQPAGKDAYSGAENQLADFSALTQPGDYFLSVPNAGASYPFKIMADPFQYLTMAAIKAYYYNRASMDLLPSFAGAWSRKGGHPDTQVFIHPSAVSKERQAGTVISAPGGWYDAGDYNKYIVNSGITMATLFNAYSDYPVFFQQLRVAIPGHTNQLPDILDEALYNLRWMLCMQDPTDGGVYHKLTSAAFDGMEMPDKDHDRRYVVQKSTAATLDFAAVMAQAVRVFEPFKDKLPGLIDSCLVASKSAWQWAAVHSHDYYDQQKLNKAFKPAITTGAYGDQDLRDETYWAATALLLATGDTTYLQSLQQHAPEHLTPPSWSSVDALADALLVKCLQPGDIKLLPGWSAAQQDILRAGIAGAKKRLLTLADQLISQPNAGNATIMGGRSQDFAWGSSSVAANQGMILLQAYQLTSDTRYQHAAISNLDYLLGRNSTGYCFVTGFGATSPMHPHHRISIADGIQDPVPGFLVGGPNPGQQDGVKNYPSKTADRSYTDQDAAYACNEVAINWNAPLIYLISGLEASQSSESNKQ